MYDNHPWEFNVGDSDDERLSFEQWLTDVQHPPLYFHGGRVMIRLALVGKEIVNAFVHTELTSDLASPQYHFMTLSMNIARFLLGSHPEVITRGLRWTHLQEHDDPNGRP